MYKSIRHSVTFAARPQEVYELLMDTQKHSGFTGAPAEVSREVGGLFSAYGGAVGGINLELVPGRRIVQFWNGAEWPEGHYSTVIYELEEMDNGTHLAFMQAGVPQEHYDEINEGWKSNYWEKMQAALDG